MFRTFDTDGSGEIAYDEFEAMVEELGLRVAGTNSAAQLLSRFDTKGEGALSYTQFVTQVLKVIPRVGQCSYCFPVESGRSGKARSCESVGSQLHH